MSHVIIKDPVVGVAQFKSHPNLKTVTFGADVREIGVSAFIDCRSLTTVDFNNAPLTIGAGAFEYCISLTTVLNSGNVTVIGSGAFRECVSLKKFAFAADLKKVETYAFSGCRALTRLDFSQTVVTTIGYAAFQFCTSLEKVGGFGLRSGSSATLIASSAFWGCTALTEFDFRWTHTIAYLAFVGCRKLTRVAIPAELRTIGFFAFRACGPGMVVTGMMGVTSLESDSPYKRGTASHLLKANGCEFDPQAQPGVFDSGTRFLLGNDRDIFGNKVDFNNGRCTAAYVDNRECFRIELDGHKVKIPANAFYNCQWMKHIILPATVASIADGAFRQTPLKTVYVPSDSAAAGHAARNRFSKEPRVEIKDVVVAAVIDDTGDRPAKKARTDGGV